MKRKILVVDDERRIGTLVNKLIHWEELDMECVGIFDNVENALACIKENKPEIVITDIRMPKINGLDLIRMVRDINIDTYFIVISGYKEFEYAHRALEEGVENYLLKPINEQELNEVLAKIKGKIEALNEISVMRENYEKSVSESNKIIKRDFLNNIIDQEKEPYYSNSVEMKGELYRGITIKLDYIDYKQANKRQEELLLDRVRDIIESILVPELEEVLVCEKENLHIYCLFNYNVSKVYDISSLLSEILLKIKEHIMGLDQYEVTIGIGLEKNNFSEIRFSILEAYRAVCNRLVYGTGRLIYFEDIRSEDEIEIEKDLEDTRSQVYSAIESYSRDALNKCIRKIYDSMSKKKIDMTTCFTAAEKFIDIFLEYADINNAEKGILKKQWIAECQHCNKAAKIRRTLEDRLGECLDNMRINIEARSTKPIRLAKEYIEDHYSEKIMLEDIAAIVDLNPVYFSTLFKKETEMNFSTYLTQVRMEHAKKQLITTNDTVAAIGMSVGYEDQKYFSQVFRKVVGIKPVVYRKIHS